MKADGDLRSIFRDRLPAFDWQPVETGSTGTGVPDSNYCHNSAEGWCEFKLTNGYAVIFQTEQPAWIHRRTRHGGRVWIVVRRFSPPNVDTLYMVPGAHVLALAERGLHMPPRLCHLWAGGPTRWDWARVADLLISPPSQDFTGNVIRLGVDSRG